MTRHFDFGAAYNAARAEHAAEPATFSIGDETFACREPFPVMAVHDFLLGQDTLDRRIGFLQAAVVDEDWDRLLATLRAMDPPLDRDGLFDLIAGILQTVAARPTSPSADSASTLSPDGTSSSGDASNTASAIHSEPGFDASAESPTP